MWRQAIETVLGHYPEDIWAPFTDDEKAALTASGGNLGPGLPILDRISAEVARRTCRNIIAEYAELLAEEARDDDEA